MKYFVIFLLVLIVSFLGLICEDYLRQMQRDADRAAAEARTAESNRIREHTGNVIRRKWSDAAAAEEKFMETGEGYDDAVTKFKAVASKADPCSTSLAETKIARLGAAREKFISKTMSGIEARAAAMAGERRYAEAAELCSGYSGIWRQETEDSRSKLADRYSEEAKIYEEEERKRKAVCESRDKFFGEVAKLVSSVKYKEALELLNNTEGDIIANDVQELDLLRASLKSLAGIDVLIAANLNDMAG